MTAAQQRAAEPTASVWVTASAGTGKTKVLTDRVLRLLLGGTAPGHILCLTFTRAAAAEMANRISDELSGWATAERETMHVQLSNLLGHPPNEDETLRARRLFADVLDVPGGMKIETIHAFCQSLLRRFPVEARVAPHFDVADERTSKELLAMALQRILRRAKHGTDDRLADAFATVTAQISEHEFTDLLGELMRGRGRLKELRSISGGPEALIQTIYRRLDVDPDADPNAAVDSACRNGAFDRGGLANAADALAGGSKNDQMIGARIANWLAQDAHTRARAFTEYSRAFLTSEDVPRKALATKKTAESHPDILATLVAEQRRVCDAVERHKAAQVAAATAALLRLGDALDTYYAREKAAHAVLDYDDQISETNKLLSREDVAPWVLFKLDGGLDHILIDEAQDTSPEQWAIISALAKEFFAGEGAQDVIRTLFAVGDEKQSIFSFQGADPKALRRMRQYFHQRVVDAERHWESVPLERSFRSAEAVLAAVDAVFVQDAARDGVALSGEAIRHEAHRAGQAGLVELWPPVEPAERAEEEPWALPITRSPADDPAAILADAIADRVREWVRSTEPEAENAWLSSRNRQIRPGDVMVLVRRRTAFVDHLVRALKDREIEVAGIDRMVLTEQLAVMDLMALGDILLLPSDDLTLAVVLKGPLIGFAEDDLFELAYDRGARSLWDTLRARRGEQPNFSQAYDYLATLLARADFVPPYELFADVLGARRGRRALLARLGSEAADPMDEFLALALAFERAHPPSLQGFLHWLRAGRSEIKRDLEQGRGEVRIMTVHGAKGLQAPIVILPDTLQTPTSSPRILWATGNDGNPLPLWPGRQAREESVTREARGKARAEQMEEYRRLMYVAMTRAEDRLYVCGWRGRRGAPEGCWYNLIASGLAALPQVERFGFDHGARWRGEGLRLQTAQLVSPDQPARPPPPTPSPEALPDFARTAALDEPEPPRPLAPSSRLAEVPPAESPLDATGVGRFRRGRLVHRLLELLPDVAEERRAQVATEFLARAARDLDEEARISMASGVLSLLAEPEFAPLFGPGSLAEVPIAALLGKSAVAGQVDRLLIEEDRAVVIDYKSGRRRPKTESEVPQPYLRQMAAYRAALRQIFPERSVACGLLFTDGPQLLWLSDAALDRHAP